MAGADAECSAVRVLFHSTQPVSGGWHAVHIDVRKTTQEAPTVVRKAPKAKYTSSNSSLCFLDAGAALMHPPDTLAQGAQAPAQASNSRPEAEEFCGTCTLEAEAAAVSWPTASCTKRSTRAWSLRSTANTEFCSHRSKQVLSGFDWLSSGVPELGPELCAGVSLTYCRLPARLMCARLCFMLIGVDQSPPSSSAQQVSAAAP